MKRSTAETYSAILKNPMLALPERMTITLGAPDAPPNADITNTITLTFERGGLRSERGYTIVTSAHSDLECLCNEQAHQTVAHYRALGWTLVRWSKRDER